MRIIKNMVLQNRVKKLYSFFVQIKDMVQFWGYGLGRTVIEKKFSKDENLIMFKGKYMENL